MERAVDVAKYTCDKYREIAGETIDEMKLHKLLYFSQRESIALTGEPLFNDRFEGWRYGPVCIAVRKNFYDGEMLGNDFKTISKSSSYIVDNIISQYGELASWKLSELTHKEISWINSRKGLSSNENGEASLKLEDIIKDAEKVRPYDSIWDMYVDEFEDYEDA